MVQYEYRYSVFNTIHKCNNSYGSFPPNNLLPTVRSDYKKLGAPPIASNGLKPVWSDSREQIYLKIIWCEWSIRLMYSINVFISSFRYRIHVFSSSSTACSLALLNSVALMKSFDVSNTWWIASLSLGDMPNRTNYLRFLANYIID